MRTDLVGRVVNLRLRSSHVLQPVFEAVSNSLHAIEDARRNDGCIRLVLVRDPDQQRLPIVRYGDDHDVSQADISSIEIIDNGVGFTKDNFESFMTLDSRKKARIGGKGVGRLVWLKIFSEAVISSVYREGDTLRRRRFRFALPEGVSDIQDELITDTDIKTSITLQRIHPERASLLPRRVSTIQNQLLNHFLPYLFVQGSPEIQIEDDGQLLRVSPSDVLEHKRVQLEIDNIAFHVDHIKVRSPEDRTHAVFYCAAGRVVESEKLRTLPPSPLQDDGTGFFYHAYVSSSYLDEKVNQERTAFSLDEAKNLVDEVGLSQIRTEVQRQAQEFLEPFVSRLREVRSDRVAQVLDDRVPEYRYVRETNPEVIESLPLDAREEEIELAIADQHFRNQRTGRRLLASVIADVERHTTLDFTTFSTRYEQEFHKLNQITSANLISYLLFRRAIIDLYDRVLRKAGDKFQREAAIHELMFPMGKDLDSTSAYLEHNLWLIDERLTYASYIASDKPIRDHRILFEPTDEGEPDVAAYFNFGFSSDSLDGPLQTVVLVEFKRPGPLAKREEDPYQQVLRYIRRIREGFHNDLGQKVKATDSTRFYCYVVCDLDGDEVERMITTYQFLRLFDGEEGYFLYNAPLRAYIEIVPFEKVLRDAKRNHRAFFERAGIR